MLPPPEPVASKLNDFISPLALITDAVICPVNVDFPLIIKSPLALILPEAVIFVKVCNELEYNPLGNPIYSKACIFPLALISPEADILPVIGNLFAVAIIPFSISSLLADILPEADIWPYDVIFPLDWKCFV